jgi:hypothetical protein
MIGSLFSKANCMNRKFLTILFFSLSIITISCSEKEYEARIQDYLNANTIEEKGQWLADEYRSYFFAKEGEGENRTEALASFDNWDGNLHPDVKIINKSVIKKKRKWIVTILEQNDFSKLIGYPGWKATEEITFDHHDKIIEMIYKPDSTNPPYKKWLQPALDWLKQNQPGELAQIYSDNKLVKTKAAALQWVKVLSEWQKAKG